MPQMKEERDPVPRPSEGNTVVGQGENQAPKAQMPHERDESSHSQAAEASSNQRMGQLAHDAVADGQKDTSKAVETDATYHQVRKGTPAGK